VCGATQCDHVYTYHAQALKRAEEELRLARAKADADAKAKADAEARAAQVLCS
jgi:hypothetical protein